MASTSLSPVLERSVVRSTVAASRATHACFDYCIQSEQLPASYADNQTCKKCPHASNSGNRLVFESHTEDGNIVCSRYTPRYPPQGLENFADQPPELEQSLGPTPHVSACRPICAQHLPPLCSVCGPAPSPAALPDSRLQTLCCPGQSHSQYSQPPCKQASPVGSGGEARCGKSVDSKEKVRYAEHSLTATMHGDL